MGKAQSKRSLEITTDTKKEGIEDGIGEVKKLGDENELQLQVNGDTHHNDTETTDKEKSVEGENEKDLSTEKDEHKGNANEVEKGHIENGIGSNEDTVIKENSLENGHDETLNGSKTSTPVTAENDEGSKKKKEKKKKWSFRNISFGKRDKQKPAKKEEENVNGECEKVPEEQAVGDNTGTKENENDTQNNVPNAEEQTNDTQMKETTVESNQNETSEQQPAAQQQPDAAETETSPDTEVRESTTTDNKDAMETETAVDESSKTQEPQPNGKSEQTIPVVTIEENGVTDDTHEDPVDTPNTDNVNEVVEIVKPTEEIKSATENNCQQTVEMTDESMKQTD